MIPAYGRDGLREILEGNDRIDGRAWGKIFEFPAVLEVHRMLAEFSTV